MKYHVFALALLIVHAVSFADPEGKYANLNKYPNCEVYFDFIDDGVVYVPDNSNNRMINASWGKKGGLIVVQTNLWESYYQYIETEQKLIWNSIKIGKDLRDITKQYALTERTLSACP